MYKLLLLVGVVFGLPFVQHAHAAEVVNFEQVPLGTEIQDVTFDDFTVTSNQSGSVATATIEIIGGTKALQQQGNTTWFNINGGFNGEYIEFDFYETNVQQPEEDYIENRFYVLYGTTTPTPNSEIMQIYACRDSSQAISFQLVDGPLSQCTTVGRSSSYLIDNWITLRLHINYQSGEMRLQVNNEFLPWVNVAGTQLETYKNVLGIGFETGNTLPEIHITGIDNIHFADSNTDYGSPTCNFSGNVDLATVWQDAIDFHDDDEYTTGIVFTPTADCSFNRFETRLRNSTGYDEYIDARLWTIPTPTSHLADGELIDVSLVVIDVEEKAGLDNVVFEFLRPQYLKAGVNYVITLEPFNRPAFDHEYVQIAGYPTPYGNPITSYYYKNNLDRKDPLPYEPYFELWTEYYTYASLELDKPCSILYEEQGECVYAVPDITGEAIDIVGTSTGNLFGTSSYKLSISIYDINANAVYRDERIVNSSVLPYGFDVTTSIEQFGTGVYLTQVCQQGLYDDVDLNSGICVNAFIGWGLTETETQSVLDGLGNVLGNILQGTVDEEIAACDYENFSDYLNVFKSIKCGFLWAFVPDDEALSLWNNGVEDLKTVVPIGYITLAIREGERVLDDSNDSSGLDLTMNLEPFNLDRGTTTLPLLSGTALANGINTFYDPFRDYFLVFMYTLLAAWVVWFSAMVLRKLHI